jgi:X-X-X-Leu-X-X-Gly heptad repeat protein
MNPIAFALDLLLVSLLLIAVWIGIRLERRLKTLRDSQAGFVNAVNELNDGVGRAQSGLQELKAATLAARTELADRVQDAKGMLARLERGLTGAEASARGLEGVIERAQGMRVQAFQTHSAPIAATATPPSRYARPAATAQAADEQEEPLMLRRAALSRPSAIRETRRMSLDEDLFETPGARR